MLHVGAAVMRGIAAGLGVEEDFFERESTAADPYWVARVIHYPPLPAGRELDGGFGLAGSRGRWCCGLL